MSTNTITKASPADAGCWIDGHWGRYGTPRLIEIAQDHGMVLDRDDEGALKSYGLDIEDFRGEDNELHDAAEWVIGQGGLGDFAEEWMNENVAPDGFYFGWNDGEFFLWDTETWEES